MNKFVQTLLHGHAVPRVIQPRTHEILDWIVTGYFLILAGANWGRHRRATATALINAAAVGSLIALTDYDGDGRKPLSFEDHGKMDLVQAGMASGLPVLLGFGSSAVSIPFQAQAMDELLVVAATNWEANERGAQREEDIAA
jgi:hypothetical protein